MCVLKKNELTKKLQREKRNQKNEIAFISTYLPRLPLLPRERSPRWGWRRRRRRRRRESSALLLLLLLLREGLCRRDKVVVVVAGFFFFFFEIDLDVLEEHDPGLMLGSLLRLVPPPRWGARRVAGAGRSLRASHGGAGGLEQRRRAPAAADVLGVVLVVLVAFFVVALLFAFLLFFRLFLRHRLRLLASWSLFARFFLVAFVLVAASVSVAVPVVAVVAPWALLLFRLFFPPSSPLPAAAAESRQAPAQAAAQAALERAESQERNQGEAGQGDDDLLGAVFGQEKREGLGNKLGLCCNAV